MSTSPVGHGPDPAGPDPAGPDPADVFGLDNVRLDLPLAGVGSRFLAVTLDQLALAVILLLFMLAAISVGSLFASFNGWLIAATAFGIFTIQWGYFSACEILMGGQTPGKMAVGLRTVSHLGGRPSTAAIVTRNFLRSFDFLLGLPIMILDRRSRRLGDLVASTLVVHDRDQPSLRLGRMPPHFGAREIAVSESFLRRADSMETATALELASRLLTWLERRDPDWVAEAMAGETPAALADSLTRLRFLLQPEWIEAGN